MKFVQSFARVLFHAAVVSLKEIPSEEASWVLLIGLGYDYIRSSCFSTDLWSGGVGTGFLLTCQDLGKSSTIHSLSALFVCVCVWRLAHTHEFHFLSQDQSTVA